MPESQLVDAYEDQADLQVFADTPYVLHDQDWQAVNSDFGDYSSDPPIDHHFHPSLRDEYPPQLLDVTDPFEPLQILPSEAGDGSDIHYQQRRQSEYYRVPRRSDHVRQIS